MSETFIEVKDLEKTYTVGIRRKKFQAVKGISFEVHQGEIFAIVGPNGAGKTSTLKMLTGLIKPTGGSARIFGHPVTHVESRRRMGYLPEGPYFYEHLTVRELLHYYGALHGIARADLVNRTNELIERVGLTHAEKRPIRKFSKGMRQRAGLAQALINDPELVILDEPQSGLDPVGRKEVRDLIFDLKRQGKTVVLSSHILPDVEAVCDRVAVLHQGELKEIGTLHELTSERNASIEIFVRPMSAKALDQLKGLKLKETRGQILVLRFEGHVDLRETIEHLYQLGAEILSVTPQKENLEDVFLRDTGQKARSILNNAAGEEE